MDLSPLTFLDPFTAALDNQQSEKDLTEVGLLRGVNAETGLPESVRD